MFVDGIPLDNPAYGWVFRAGSKPHGVFSKEHAAVTAPWRDGEASGIPASFTAPVRTFIIETPSASYEALLALLHGAKNVHATSPAVRTLAVETVSTDPVGYGASDEVIVVTWTFKAPGVFYRDSATSTPYRAFSMSGGTWDIFSGISAPISDPVVLIEGYAEGTLRITDSSGAWVQYSSPTALQSNDGLVFYPRTGKVFKVDTGAWGTPAEVAARTSWAGGTEESRLLSFGGPRRRFELTPLRGATPAVRAARLTVTGASSSPTIYIRGRGSYLTPA